MKTPFVFLILLTQLFIIRAYSQEAESIVNNLEILSPKYIATVEHKLSSIDEKLTQRTEKYLRKLMHQEERIQRNIKKTDSAAYQIFGKAKDRYQELSESIISKTAILAKLSGGQYSSYLDSLGTSISFLKQYKYLTNKSKDPLNTLHQLQSKLQQTENVKKFIAERKAQIKDLLSRYTHIPKGLQKQYKQLTKTAYYYSAQVKEYKEMLKDPKKIEQKALSLLNKLPAFQNFMRQNSQLASLFQVPGNNAVAPNVSGLQTRASVQTMIAQQVSMGGPNAMAQVQQNLAAAHAEINKLKENINKLGGASSDIEMPDFKPNDQKTKSFLKRLEFGSNIQSQKSTRFFPATTDLGLSVGYKLNDKDIIGIGASYKVGLGKGWNDIHFTSQGIGLRSFVDYNIKGSFFLSGGYEQNYKADFNSIEQLKNYSAWQVSGLIGISKKYKISNKFKGNMQLLWDFMSYQQIPRSQAIVYRLGYTLK